MRRAIAVLGLLAVAPATAVSPVRFDLPAGSLENAVIAVGSAAGVTVGIIDRSLRSMPVRALRGRLDARTALRRIVAGTSAMIVEIDAETFQVVRRPIAALPLRQPAAPSPPPLDPGYSAIVVTGSKRSVRLADYPGSVQLANVAHVSPDRMTHGSDALVERLPILASTHLGPGRDKLFIRGLADSSFAGPTRATVGQYLGDVRLNYNAPDPNLALHDIREVEVLEGPQGTLYGAGSLGGIIRLEPEPPDLTRLAAEIAAGVSATRYGAPGADANAVLNLPLIPGRVALRAVAYGALDGGYIDDRTRGLADINRTTTRGGRATLRIVPAPDWTIDAGGVVQDINSRDGQYAERGLLPLQRRSTIPQPFDNDYGLASLVVRHSAGKIDLVSATSFVSHDLATTYDATLPGSILRRYASDDRIHIFANETRLSHRAASGTGWIVGIELLHSSDRLTRTLGTADVPVPISGTRNVVEEASAFGEVTVMLRPRLLATAGGRLSYDRQISERLDAAGEGEEPRRHALSMLPSIALLWRPASAIGIYARYQEGYRPGGLSVQASSTQRFEADSVGTWEAGARLGSPGDPLTLTGAVSYAHWEDVQADLVDASGLPYTANIGSGRIFGFELSGTWRPVAELAVDAALFADSSRLYRPAAGYDGEGDRSLPNIPAFVGRVGLRYGVRAAGRPITLHGSVRYLGRSRLGIGPLLDIRQGGVWDVSAGANIELGRATLSLDIANLTDSRGNLFALGNPFGVTRRDQVTPPRPATVRIGLRMRY